MRNITIILLLAFFFTGCKEQSKRETDSKLITTSEQKANDINQMDCYVKLSTLKKRGGGKIGDIYVNSDNGLFDELYVINEKDTVYSIKDYVFTNIKKVDIELIPSVTNTYYKFIMINRDYFILSALSDGGKNVSDDITIEWNYEDEILEVLILP